MRRNVILGMMGLVVISVLALTLAVDATDKKEMDVSTHLEIERACERQVYSFLHFFERDHDKAADLFTKDGSVPFPVGKITVGRDAIREFFSTIDAKDVELNVLLANNLRITVVDENNAKGSCYVTHLQHRFEDSKREGQGVLGEPNSVTAWHWNFERVEGEWKIGEVDVDLVLLNGRFLEYFEE